MTMIKRWLAALTGFVALIVALVVWTLLPWQLALALVVVLASWLRWTRMGRLTWAAAQIGLSSLPQRWGAASVIIVGIAGVVLVLVAMLSMGEGFERLLRQTGSEDTVIVLRGGARAEGQSALTVEQVRMLETLPGVAKDERGAILSAEVLQVVRTEQDVNLQLRGVAERAWMLRPSVQIIAGRRFSTGLRELVVGRGIHSRYAGWTVGSEVKLGGQTWRVVGHFTSNDAYDSELWADAQTVASVYARPGLQSVMLALDGAQGLQQLQDALAADSRLKLDAVTTRAYYSRQSAGLTQLIRMLATVIGVIMAVGAVFGALNTMYAAVAMRGREIATVRAIGFRGLPVVSAVMLETSLLAATGGVLGATAAWLIFNGYSASTLSNNFGRLTFEFQVSLPLLWSGLKWALAIGFIGGLLPALRAGRAGIADALRAV